MTLGDLLDALAARGSTLVVNGTTLRHRGPRFAEGDPTRRALATFHDELLHLVTTGRLCCFCPRLLARSDKIVCALHRIRIEETAPMGLKKGIERLREMQRAAGIVGDDSCRSDDERCRNQEHEHFNFDDFFDEWRASLEDDHLECGITTGAA
jgi:hypothetical protein